MTQCVATGVAGLSIENRTSDPNSRSMTTKLAVERIRPRARHRRGRTVLLVARCEGFLAASPI